MLNLFDRFKGLYGEVEEYEQYSKSEVKKGEYDKYVLTYKCKTSQESNPVYVKLYFILIDDDYLLEAMIFNTDKEFVDDYDENVKSASDLVDRYYEYVNSDNIESLVSLLRTTNNIFITSTSAQLRIVYSTKVF